MTEHSFEQMRRAMVASQLRTTGVSDPRVLAAMGAVPREHFVPPDRVPVAYAEVLVPVGGGRTLNSPMALGRLLTEAAIEPQDHVLVVGAATGYAAAVVARLAASVVALEEDTDLLARAGDVLAGTDVALVSGPLAKGWKKQAPYDVILIDGAVEQLPDTLVEQLADGGRLAAGLIDHGVQRLTLGRRAGTGFGVTSFADADCCTLPGFEPVRTFTF